MVNSLFGQHLEDLVPGDDGFELHEGGLDVGNELTSDEADDFQKMIEDCVNEMSA